MRVTGKVKYLVTGITAAVLLLAILLFWTSNAVDKPGAFAVQMTELLASNRSYPNGDGLLCDYLELYNPSGKPIDISGYGLTDNEKEVKHILSKDTVIPARGYLVIYCGGTTDSAGYAPMGISRLDGEYLYFLSPIGEILQKVPVLTAPPDCPQILMEDGTWELADWGTPGFSNDQDGFAAWRSAMGIGENSLCFSELLASNSLYYNELGELTDFIELYNPAPESLSLGGYTITDGEGRLLYTFPEGSSVQAEGWYLLSCSPDILRPEVAPFGISREGKETYVLRDPRGLILDSLTTVPMEKNNAWIKNQEGAWCVCPYATPGFPNTDGGFEAFLSYTGMQGSQVRLTEMMSGNNGVLCHDGSSFPDWLELTNFGTEPCDLGGWFLSDDDDPLKWCLPRITLGAGESVLLWCCDGEGELYTGFGLSAHGQSITLSNAYGVQVDSVKLPPLQDNFSYSLSAEGLWEETPYITPGFPNTVQGYTDWCKSNQPAGPLVISELQSSNDSHLRYAYKTYYDWVEIQNISDQSVSLSDYYLSDDIGEPQMFRLPNVTLKPGACYTLLCTGDTSLTNRSYVCTNFSLSSQGDTLAIFDGNGSVVDSTAFGDIPRGYSYGRLSGGGFGFFSSPSPQKANSGGGYAVNAMPVTSVPGGIFEDVTQGFYVELSAAGDIYYTLDGDIPTKSSRKYTGPIYISRTTVLRAICTGGGLMNSPVMTESYIVNEGHTLPVVSLVSPSSGLFSNESGIYVKGYYENYYQDWERTAHVALYEPDGTTFSINCGLKMFGAGSRETCSKKSFKLLFKGRYDGPLECDVFEDGAVTTFGSLVLRAGEDYRFAVIRDELCGDLAMQTGDEVMVQNARYSVLYVNGEYFGIYAIKEHYSPEYYGSHKNVSPESVSIMDAPLWGGEMLSIIHKAASMNMRSDEALEYVASRVSLESLIDWTIIQAWAGNTDIPGNLRYIKSTEGDGLWRYCYYDSDWTLRNRATFNIVLKPGMQHGSLPNSLLKNEQFQEMFCKRLAELCRTVLNRENVNQVLDKYLEQVTPEMKRDHARWELSMRTWETRVEDIREAVNERDRCGELIASICEKLGLSSAEKKAYFGELVN